MSVFQCLEPLKEDTEVVKEGDDLIKRCLDMAPEGLIMEFGVATGSSFNLILSYTDRNCYGFDSFEGLPEESFWGSIGSFKCEIPKIEHPHGELVVGLIQDTLEPFLKDHQGQAAFVHIDVDIYSSAKYILDTLYDHGRLKSGSIIMFDELFHFPTWEINEYKALSDFGERTNIEIEFLGRRNDNSYAFRIL